MFKDLALIVCFAIICGGIGIELHMAFDEHGCDTYHPQITDQSDPDFREQVVPERMSEDMHIRFIKVNGPFWYKGQDDDDFTSVLGLTSWAVDENGVTHCTIWGPIPKHVYGDDAMDTLGHEFLHCIAGSFHAE